MTTITLIAAMDRNRAIGRGNALPWHLPDDLKRFKALTLGKPILMGRKTAESLGRALPGRLNLVLTRSGKASFPGMEAVATLRDALRRCGDAPELMVIGGGEVYALAMPLATHLHLTLVDTEVAGADAWFPDFDAGQWQVQGVQEHPGDERHELAFSCREYYRREPENACREGSVDRR